MPQYPWEDNVLPLTEALRLSKAAAGGLKVNGLLEDQHGRAKTNLQTAVEVIDTDEFPSVDTLYSEKRTWYRMRNVVAVSVDL